MPLRIKEVEEPIKTLDERPYIASAQFNAAAAANYDANDVIARNATGSIARALQVPARNRSGWLVGISVQCSEDSVTCRLRVHVFSQEPQPSVEMGDGAATNIVDRNGYLYSVDLTAFTDKGGISQGENFTVRRPYVAVGPGEPQIYLVFETLDAETAETAGMTLWVDLYLL